MEGTRLALFGWFEEAFRLTRKQMKPMRKTRFLRHESLESRQLLDASGLGAGEPLDDFQLDDVNSTSPTYQQAVSPQDFRGGASAWYFFHST